MTPEVKALEAAAAVEVLRLREGDVVFVTVPDEWDPEVLERVKRHVGDRIAATGIKNVGLIVKGSSVKVQVLRPDAAYEKHADDCLQGCDQFPAPGCIEGNELYGRKSNPI